MATKQDPVERALTLQTYMERLQTRLELATDYLRTLAVAHARAADPDGTLGLMENVPGLQMRVERHGGKVLLCGLRRSARGERWVTWTMPADYATGVVCRESWLADLAARRLTEIEQEAERKRAAAARREAAERKLLAKLLARYPDALPSAESTEE